MQWAWTETNLGLAGDHLHEYARGAPEAEMVQRNITTA